MTSSRKYFLGMDEAGRGSVIGPLVMGAVVIDEKTLEDYTTTEITDSKQLSSIKRTELFDLIKESAISYSAVLLHPSEIDSAVLSLTSNLNMLELQTMAQLIKKHSNATDIYIDAISKPDYCTTNLKTLLQEEKSFLTIKKAKIDTLHITKMHQELKKHITLIAQNKADLNYKVVSAASIIAKVTRDLEIRKIEKEYGLEEHILASGYPNQQLQPFLKKYKKEIKERTYPFIRYSWDWAPLKAIIAPDKLKQSKLLF